jgi:DNA-binding beta-propeller fold protein YncE
MLMLKNLVRMLPAVVILAATVNTMSCNNNNGLFPQSGGGGGSTIAPTSTSLTPTPSATPTSTIAAAALAFVTNFNDGMVSSFTRNTSTGALAHSGQVQAGANAGPRGVVASPNGSFLYVANINDDNIYEFSINRTDGTLTALATPSVSNGNATEPDELAMNRAGTLLWATGRAGTVTAYTVDTTTGQLARKSSIDGFNTPFGIAVHPTLPVIYVSDLKTGLIQPMSYNIRNGMLSKNFTAVASSDRNAVSPAAITIDAAGAALFAPDQGNGEVSSFAIDGSGALTPMQAATNGKVGVVDRQGVFVYTANSADGTVAVSKIKGACPSRMCAGATVSAESPHKANSGPFGITLVR